MLLGKILYRKKGKLGYASYLMDNLVAIKQLFDKISYYKKSR
jgi:hypothetical protein